MNNVFDGIEMPMGLGMALPKNVPALDMFSNMDASHKQAVIDYTHQINSKNEMHEFVREIATDSGPPAPGGSELRAQGRRGAQAQRTPTGL